MSTWVSIRGNGLVRTSKTEMEMLRAVISEPVLRFRPRWQTLTAAHHLSGKVAAISKTSLLKFADTQEGHLSQLLSPRENTPQSPTKA
jgi:hypothetical protein